MQSSVFFYIPNSHRVIIARAQHDIQILALFEAENGLLVEFLLRYFLESIDRSRITYCELFDDVILGVDLENVNHSIHTASQ